MANAALLNTPERQWRAGQLLGWPMALLGATGVMSLGDIPLCGFRHLTGLPCPLCGGTRVCAALAQGDIVSAWQANPGMLFLLAIAFVYSIQFAWEAWTGREAERWRLGSRVWQLGVTGLLLVWLLRLGGQT